MAKRADTTEPKFPYTTEPKALRRLLAEIPKRPKPSKLTLDTLRAWNVSKNNNSRTAIRVLRGLGLVGPNGEPTEFYVEYMKTGVGPGVLGSRVKDVYRILFENSHSPQTESNEELRKLFNIHSGGGEDVMRLQVQTFKVLAEFAQFNGGVPGAVASEQGSRAGSGGTSQTQQRDARLPPIQVDLHIHLPENKTSRDYEAIIQDIARYIYGREIERR